MGPSQIKNLVIMINDEIIKMIYNQYYNVTEQEKEMIVYDHLHGAHVHAPAKGALQGSSADNILVPGTRLIAIVVAILDNENKKQEEYTLHQDLSKCIQAIEERFEKELINQFPTKKLSLE